MARRRGNQNQQTNLLGITDAQAKQYQATRQAQAAAKANPSAVAVPGISVQGTKVVTTPGIPGSASTGQQAAAQQQATATPGIVKPVGGVVAAGPASQYIPAADQQASSDLVRKIISGVASPGAKSPFSTLYDGSVHWLSQLFDTEDEKDLSIAGVNLAPVESVFDGFIKGMGWTYDRLSQAETWAVSAAPGGLDTLSWDQSGQVSPGQAMQASGAELSRQFQGALIPRIGRPLGTFLGSAAAATISGPGGGTFGALAAGMDQSNPLLPASVKPGFDITSPAQRQAAFQDSGIGKWTTGLTDTAVAVALDPGIFAGKALKITRVRQLDRLLDTEEKVNAFAGEMAKGRTILDNNLAALTDDAGAPVRDAAGQVVRESIEDLPREFVDGLKIPPVAKFLHAVTERSLTPTGSAGKRMSLDEIWNHHVIRYAANRDALSVALHGARTYDEAELIMRHAAGDFTAQAALAERRPDLLVEVLNGERRLVDRMLTMSPQAVRDASTRWAARHEQVLTELKQALKDQPDMTAEQFRVAASDAASGMYARQEAGLAQRIGFAEQANASQAHIDALRFELAQTQQMWKYAQNARYLPVGVGPAATPDEIALLSRSIDHQLQGNEAFIRAIEDASGELSGTFGALRNSVKGFAADNPLGRVVENSRRKRAARMSIAQTRQGQKGRAWKVDEFYGERPVSPVMMPVFPIARVLRWSGTERASGIVATSGIGAQESAREVRALLNGIDVYSGKARQARDGYGNLLTREDGTPIMAGGLEKKQRLVEAYQAAMLQGGHEGQLAAAEALDQIEDAIATDIAHWHGVDVEAMRQAHLENNVAITSLQDSIRQNGYWIDENGTKNYAPYLETQLQNSRFMKNWRKINQAVERSTHRGVIGKADQAWGVTSETLSQLNDIFQDVWRPSVLLRFGYTQRNVAEGLFRASAFTWSLAPLSNATKQIGLSSRNVATRTVSRAGRDARAAVERATAPGMTFDRMPKRFRQWHADQVDAIETEIARNDVAMNDAWEQLARDNAAFRAQEIDRIEAANRVLIERNAELRRKGDLGADELDELEQNSAKIADLQERSRELRFDYEGGDTVIGPAEERIIGNLRYFEDEVSPFLQARLDSMNDVVSAANEYRRQTLARRRVYDGGREWGADLDTVSAVMKGAALADPFGVNDPYASIALANLSADHANRVTAALRADTATNLLMRQQARHYVAVKPGDPTYFDGVATALNQWQRSDVGKIIISGRATGRDDQAIVQDVIGYLLGTPEGEVTARWIEQANGVKFGSRFDGYSARAGRAAAKAYEDAAPLRDKIATAQAELRRAYGVKRSAEADLARRQKSSSRTLKAMTAKDGTTFRNQEALDKYVADAREAVVRAKASHDEFIARHSEPAPMDPPNRLSVAEAEDAATYAEEMIARFDQITAGSEDLIRYLDSTFLPISPQGKQAKEAGDVVRSFLDRKNPDGSPVYSLQPVIGSDGQKLGSKNARQVLETVSQKMFHLLGTVPEDVMVRAPFYGQRFSSVAGDLYRQAVRQYGEDGITLREINGIRQAAHRRALKDTKDWLYTIERRTALGASMEWLVPFVSATQNSVTTVGRMVYKDPAILAVMRLIWQAPDRAGWTDPENADEIVIPTGWLPEGIRDAAGIGEDIRVNKRNIDLITNGVFDPTATPLVGVSSSELMKNGLFGAYTVGTPEWLSAVLPKDTADAVWQSWKDFVYGKGYGVSETFGSLDKLLAPAQRRIVEGFFQGDGSSAAFGNTFNNLRMWENYRWAVGQRPDMPTYDEIANRARSVTALRAIGNLTLFTSPDYVTDNNANRIAKMIQANDLAYYQDQAKPEAERSGVAPSEVVFGDVLTWAFSNETRGNIAGLSTSGADVDAATRYQSLQREVGPRLDRAGNLSLLGMMNFDPYSDSYDPSSTAWQIANTIPGTSQPYRKIEDLTASQSDANISAGWKAYQAGVDVIESVMHQRGIFNWGSKEAAPYTLQRQQLIANIASDPRYEGWYEEKQAQGSSRSEDAVFMLRSMLSDPTYRRDHEHDQVFGPGGIAETYLANREAILSEMGKLGIKTLKSKKGGNPYGLRPEDPAYSGGITGLAMVWEESRAALRRASPTWNAFEARYLENDIDPGAAATQFIEGDTADGE